MNNALQYKTSEEYRKLSQRMKAASFSEPSSTPLYMEARRHRSVEEKKADKSKLFEQPHIERKKSLKAKNLASQYRELAIRSSNAGDSSFHKPELRTVVPQVPQLISTPLSIPQTQRRPTSPTSNFYNYQNHRPSSPLGQSMPDYRYQTTYIPPNNGAPQLIPKPTTNNMYRPH
ncbi:hypothetical protein HDV06_001679 [Boothiomyces sp. JEL0866]|nr:hypothetical protein HDV06_001679 [Boothiomyces sp. JEL0866]